MELLVGRVCQFLKAFVTATSTPRKLNQFTLFYQQCMKLFHLGGLPAECSYSLLFKR